MTTPAPPNWNQPPAVPPTGNDIVAQYQMHVRRVFAKPIKAVVPTPAEAAKLASRGIVEQATGQYLCWRRSVMALALPLSAVSAVLATISLFRDVETADPITGIGVIVQAIPFLSVIALAVVCYLALQSWDQVGRSSRLLLMGWGGTVVAPVAAAILPLEWVVDVDQVRAASGNAGVLSIRILVGLGYAVSLLPAAVTLPGGVVSACGRVKSFLPQTTVAGYFLLIAAPLYALLFTVALILIQQIVGNVLLLIGVGLVASGTVIHLVRRQVYTKPILAEADQAALDRTQNQSTYLALAGYGVILLWALTTDVEGLRLIGNGETAILSPVAAVQKLLEFLPRYLISTAVFCNIFLGITATAWRQEQVLRSTPEAARLDNQLAWIEYTLMIDDQKRQQQAGGTQA